MECVCAHMCAYVCKYVSATSMTMGIRLSTGAQVAPQGMYPLRKLSSLIQHPLVAKNNSSASGWSL